jgi:uncharacterized protein
LNLYLDTSALVKLYVREPGTDQVYEVTKLALSTATSWVAYVEFVSALTRSVRIRTISRTDATRKVASFHHNWDNLIQIEASKLVITRAATVAWEQGLRGYDSVHLASALIWQEVLAEPVTFATYDRELGKAAAQVGFPHFPP